MKAKIKHSKRLTGLLALTVLVMCSAQASAASIHKTKYPVVLVHGFLGFGSIFGLDYFYGVKNALTSGGSGPVVYAPNVTAVSDAYTRGKDLIKKLDTYKAAYGHSKFNLFGHSLGGPTIRYVAKVRPDLVASITTINAVNYGSKFADSATALLPPGSTGYNLVTSALNLLGSLVDSLAGDPQYTQDADATIQFMTTAKMNAFNNTFSAGKPTSYCGSGPQTVSGIHYFSWGGSQAFTNGWDLSDYFLAASSLLIPGDEDDGMVRRCDQHWGKVIKSNYKMNHLDVQNHIFGIHHLYEVDPLVPYQQQASRLKNMGL